MLASMWMLYEGDRPLFDNPTEASEMLVVVLMTLVHTAEDNASPKSDAAVLWYWLLASLRQWLDVGSLAMSNPVSNPFVATRVAVAFNSLTVFLLAWQVPKTRQTRDNKHYDRADTFGLLTMSWLSPILNTCMERDATRKDLPDTPNGFNVRDLTTEFARVEAAHPITGGWTLAKVLFRMHWSSMLGILVGDLGSALLRVSQTYVLHLLILFVRQASDGQASSATGSYLAVLLAIMVLAVALFENFASMCMVQMSNGIRGTIYGSVYRKALQLSPSARSKHTPPEIMNYIGTDLNQVLMAYGNATDLLTAPITFVTTFYSLYTFVGWHVLGGLASIALMMPVTSYISSYIHKRYIGFMKAKDDRAKVTSNVFANAKSLKLYGWEDAFLKRIEEVRTRELSGFRSIVRVQVTMSGLWSSSQSICTLFVFGSYLYFSGKSLTADIAFPALSLFMMLSLPLSALPMTIMSIVQSSVSHKRVAAMLSAPDHNRNNYEHVEGPATDSDSPLVQFSDVQVYWDETPEAKLALDKASFSVGRGELLCVVGRVGTGKSSLLKTVNGELDIRGGSVRVRGSLAYVPQEPWLINQSIRENILFGSRYNKEWYDRTVEACALLPDIEGFADGDETEIGEKGVSLSGGQKARVCIARAVYAMADVYVLDDVLSAVDEHVGKHLISRLLGPHGLLRNAAVVLATNSIKVLNQATNIALIRDHTIAEYGSRPEVMSNPDSAILQLIREFGNLEDDEDVDLSSNVPSALPSRQPSPPAGGNPNGPRDVHHAASAHSVAHPREQGSGNGVLVRRPSVASLNSLVYEDVLTDKVTAKKEETMVSGSVAKDLYFRYFKLGGIVYIFIGLGLLLLVAAITNALNVWMMIWTDATERGDDNSWYYLLVYSAIGLSTGVGWGAAIYFINAIANLRSARKLQAMMAKSVLRSPMSFFETQPLGRIMNRFTTDVSDVDQNVGMTVFLLFYRTLFVIIALIMVLVTTPFVIAAAIPLTFLYFYFQRYYMAASRQLKRISTTTTSPVMANFEESMKGISVINAFQLDKRFVFKNDRLADYNFNSKFVSESVDRWLSLRLNFVGSIMIAVAGLCGVYLAVHGSMTGGFMGLIMSNAIRITSVLTEIVKATVRFETQGVTLERLFEYCDLPSEAPGIVEGRRPAAHWPAEGRVEFQNYSARYRPELDLALRDISFSTKIHEKIGVVGRTGAGKSTLTLALFRIIEAASGHIDIDGVNTSELGLTDLRRKLSIIPQDSQMFNGTIRDNIDPFDEHDDTELWRVLDLCHLKDHVSKMEGGLDAQLTDGGSNLSKGQAQLISLARALLHESNVLLLDEATSSVDVQTDAILQKTIRSEFKDRTIITIAHRLNTIIDSDRILVLDKGRVKEFDDPQTLLADETTIFADLWRQGRHGSGSVTPASHRSD